MTKILAFGTFDNFHPGHINFLTQAAAKGDFLSVIISRDDTVARVKKGPPVHPEKARQRKIAKLGLADQIILGDKKNPYQKIQNIRPDIICLGYDQRVFVEGLTSWLRRRKMNVKIIRLKPFHKKLFKSSKLNKKSLLIATKNPGKLREYRIFLKGLSYNLVSLEDLGIDDDYNENYSTIQKNAVGKVKHFARLTSLATIADDTGFKVWALHGRPGVHAKRFAGPNKTNKEIVAYLLKKMKGVPKGKRGARFVCCIAWYDPGESRLITARGEVDGEITYTMKKGKRSFCYDSVFYYDKLKKTFSEMPQQQKNSVSHRGIAMKRLKVKL